MRLVSNILMISPRNFTVFYSISRATRFIHSFHTGRSIQIIRPPFLLRDLSCQYIIYIPRPLIHLCLPTTTSATHDGDGAESNVEVMRWTWKMIIDRWRGWFRCWWIWDSSLWVFLFHDLFWKAGGSYAGASWSVFSTRGESHVLFPNIQSLLQSSSYVHLHLLLYTPADASVI